MLKLEDLLEQSPVAPSVESGCGLEIKSLWLQYFNGHPEMILPLWPSLSGFRIFDDP